MPWLKVTGVFDFDDTFWSKVLAENKKLKQQFFILNFGQYQFKSINTGQRQFDCLSTPEFVPQSNTYYSAYWM